MAISFTEIPAALRVPGSYHEISNRLAGSSSDMKVVLIIAALSAVQEKAGTTALYKPLRILSSEDAKKNLGEGQGYQIVKDLLDVNDTLEVHALPVPKDYSGKDFAKDVWPNLTDFEFQWLLYPGSDTAQITAIQTELEDRYKGNRQIGARCFYAKADTAANLLSYAEGRNSPHMVLLPLLSSENTDAARLKWLSRWTAAITKQLAIDPSSSLNQIKVKGLSSVEQFPFSTRNQFLYGGLSTWIAARDGSVYVERVVTNYTKTPEGTADSSYLDVQIPETLDAIRKYQNAEIRKRFAGTKLGPDTLIVQPGQNVLTPALLTGFLLGLYRSAFVGNKLWCVNPEKYKGSLRVELDQNDKNTIIWYDQPELIGRFDVAKGLSEFK
ncbi:hypothetical protein P0082_00940 [Candidatus Haliotispira prima]|uniref:Uncharacterized protein n=1 Tax=Candidatus Haliotispira prima TaxID=3034016 RepID=A0ABY8MHJ2_9SPIO|nr:hypothetical protein P0082_00940 [Candidatus Haliotispira prima]